MNALQEKIKKKYSEIEEIRNEESPRNLLRFCKELHELISEMHRESTDENEKVSLEDAMNGLSHTISQEVSFVHPAYTESRKKNAATIRTAEYKKTLQDAIDKIHLNIATLLD